jgi:hypothetical protein
MNGAGQARVAALLKQAWGDRVRVEPAQDGSLTAYLRGNGHHVRIIEVASESSPLLAIVAGIAADDEADDERPPGRSGHRRASGDAD